MKFSIARLSRLCGVRLRIYGPDYYDLFDSWAFTGFNVKSLEKVLEKDV